MPEKAPRDCYWTLHRFLKVLGFAQSKRDPALYLWNSGKAFVVIVVYVDDILMSGDSDSFLDLVENHFKGVFDARGGCEIKKFFASSTQNNDDFIKLHNAPMTKRLLQVFRIELWKSVKTALAQWLNLENNAPESFHDVTLFRQLVGPLLHIFNSVRLNTSSAVECHSWFKQRPAWMAWKAGKHIQRYLRVTKDIGVAYTGSKGVAFCASRDADWDCERPTRKCITRTLLLYAGRQSIRSLGDSQ